MAKPTTTIETLTDDQIISLRGTAAEVGDLLQVAICDRALDRFNRRAACGTLSAAERGRVARMTITAARAECARVIREGETP